MKDAEILNRIKRYFDIRELVGKGTFTLMDFLNQKK